MKSCQYTPRVNKLRSAIIASTMISGMSAGYAELALAQAAEESLEEVVITGSRIVRRDLNANSPIMTVDEDLFDNTGNVGIETVMNQLPQFIPAVTQFNTQSIEPSTTSTPGASTLSLRGLGSNRNLVLLDGRRAMPVNASGAIDVNMIPSSAIQRVETITGGASSVYGADAMAGVVNFILKNDYEGMELSYQYGITDANDGQTDRLNGVFGANFGDSGNVLVGFEYSRRGSINRVDRKFYRDGLADRSRAGDEFFWTAPGIAFDSATGGVGPASLNNPSQAALDQIFPVGSVNGLGSLSLYMNQDGSAYGLTGAGQTSRYKGGFFDENGNTFRKFNDDPDPNLSQNQLNTMLSIPMERYAFFARGIMDVTDNTRAFFQGTMANNQNNTVLQYTPLTGSWAAAIPHGTDIYADSLEADGITTKPAYQPGGLHGLNCAPTGGCTNSQTFPVPGDLGALLDARTNPNEPFRLLHVVDYAGVRTSSNDTFTYQLLAGLEGKLPISDWTWEASASYGFTNTSQIQTGFASVERFRALAGSPNFGKGFYYLGNDDLPFSDNFGGGIGQCTSGLPAFDFFVPSEDCLDAIRVDLRSGSDVEQKVAEANIQGRLMDLPAGELRFAAGTHYRENHFDYRVDGLNNYRSFLDSAAGLFPSSDSAGSTRAREIYTEFLIPVATGIELGGHRVMDELNLEAGYRYSDMEPSGSINTWKILFDWKINDFARLRGGKQVANRAPNIAELYQSPTQGFGFSFIGDLCSENNTHVNSAAPANPNGASVRAMCETLMGPTGSMVYYDPQRDQPTGPGFGFAFANTIGNANLENESADTVTFGGVFNLTDRTTLTVDWYQIDIQNMIALQAADSVFLRCFDPAVNTGMSLDFYECQKIARDPSNGSQAPIDITYSNQAQAKVSGVDVQLNWGTDFWNGGLNVNFMASFTDEVETRQTPTSAPTDWKGTSGIDVSGMNGGWYDYRTFTTFTYFDNAGWNASLTWRFLPPISSGAAATGETTVQDTRNYSVFDFSTGYRFGEDDRYQVSLNINNLLNEPPEFTGKDYADGTSRTTGLGTTSSGFYDVIGRQYSLRLNIDF